MYHQKELDVDHRFYHYRIYNPRFLFLIILFLFIIFPVFLFDIFLYIYFLIIINYHYFLEYHIFRKIQAQFSARFPQIKKLFDKNADRT